MNPWDIKKENFPDQGSMEEKIKFILGYAILAPSTHNTQPWRFKINSNVCQIFFDNKKKLPESDPSGRNLYISMGCMIENLLIAASYFGILGNYKILPGMEYMGEVVFEEGNVGKNMDLEYLMETIPKRVNARGLFLDKDLPAGINTRILALNKNGNIRLDLINDKKKIQQLARLTEEGLRIAYRKPSFRKEMSFWMRHSLSRKTDGLPGYSLKMPFILSFIIPSLVKLIDIGPVLGRLNYKSLSSAKVVAVFSCHESSPAVWTDIGRLAQRSMLQINSEGINTSIFVASIEMGRLDKKVQELMQTNLIPQFLFCAGYSAEPTRHSPRQNLENMLL